MNKHNQSNTVNLMTSLRYSDRSLIQLTKISMIQLVVNGMIHVQLELLVKNNMQSHCSCVRHKGVSKYFTLNPNIPHENVRHVITDVYYVSMSPKYSLVCRLTVCLAAKYSTNHGCSFRAKAVKITWSCHY